MKREGERWNTKLGKFVESPPEIEAFLHAIVKVCEQHDMTVSHEDGHGAFLIESFNPQNLEWLRNANDARDDDAE
jgi:hypothetical protein